MTTIGLISSSSSSSQEENPGSSSSSVSVSSKLVVVEAVDAVLKFLITGICFENGILLTKMKQLPY